MVIVKLCAKWSFWTLVVRVSAHFGSKCPLTGLGGVGVARPPTNSPQKFFHVLCRWRMLLSFLRCHLLQSGDFALPCVGLFFGI